MSRTINRGRQDYAGREGGGGGGGACNTRGMFGRFTRIMMAEEGRRNIARSA